MKKEGKNKAIMEAALLLALFAVICIFVPGFLSKANLLNVLRQASYTVIPAVALTMVIITSGINLSLGGIMSLAGVLGAILINKNLSPVVVFIIVGVMGIACGILNGYLIAQMRLPAFICTYTVGQIAAGLALLICNAKAVRVSDPDFIAFGNARVFGVQLIIFIAAIFALGAWFLLHRTPFGIRVYALGNNETILRQEGISIVKLQIIIYSLSCLFSALCGVLLMARLGSGSPVQGEDYTLTCIAACVIGGVDMAGGYGRIPNTVVGSIIICIINNILNLLAINNNLQQIILGSLIIILVGMSAFSAQGRLKLQAKY
ncbi:MAG: ABC transporter permease [Eubacteriales bacterium]|nr:ABC transporter permease [Eubacteriales bacterium]